AHRRLLAVPALGCGLDVERQLQVELRLPAGVLGAERHALARLVVGEHQPVWTVVHSVDVSPYGEASPGTHELALQAHDLGARQEEVFGPHDPGELLEVLATLQRPGGRARRALFPLRLV